MVFIDIGMGLDRKMSLTKNINSKNDADLFKPLFDISQQKTKCAPYSSSEKNKLDINYQIFADHELGGWSRAWRKRCSKLSS